MEADQTRHYIDLGPLRARAQPWYFVKKVLLFIPAIFLFILAIQLMKEGAAALGPSIEGQFPFANGLSDAGTGWLGAYFVLSAPRSRRRRSACSAPGRSRSSRPSRCSPARAWARRSSCSSPGSSTPPSTRTVRRRARWHRHPGDDDDRDHVHPGHADRVRSSCAGWLDGFDMHASGEMDAVLSACGGRSWTAADTVPGWALVPHGPRRDPRRVQPDRPGAAAGEQRRHGLEAFGLAEAPVDDVPAGLRRGDPDPLGLRSR